ncbi:hypothetical protein EGN72_00155, partial [Pseudorhodobacter sp. E13]|uniref:hypothetical protein n=1 Tax=Pseudorhodobacter sp. E13 TaxID=2487931 RepID=UPI000F98E6A6
ANGAAAFNLISNTQVQPNVAFNNTAWSMFWVCRLSTATSGQLARTITGVSGQFSPRLSFSSSAVNFGLYQGETATFRSSALLSSGFTNVTTLLM